MQLTAYDILGVAPVASSDEIKRAYFKLAKQYHPDVCKDPDAHVRMTNVNLAYQAIQDGRGRFWTPPIEQSAPARAELPPMSEMIRFANSHDVDDAYLLMIEVGGRDQYSRMTLEELEERAKDTARYVKSVVNYKSSIYHHKKIVGTALRWYLRGMKVDVAIKKAYADDWYYRFAGRRTKG